MKRFERLTYQQLRGADYGLRVAHTSTVIRGEALRVVEMLINECRAQMKRQLRARERAKKAATHAT